MDTEILSGRSDRARRLGRAAERAAIVPLLVVFALLVTACSPGSGYEVRIEALRATIVLQEGVPLSLWLYPGDSGKELAKVFVSGRITGTEWIELEERYVTIPRSAVTEELVFDLRVELNPNRLATPSDAIFRAEVPLAEIVALGAASRSVLLRAESGAPFELRLAFRESGKR
jgi:hypothetical protein